MPPRVPLFNEAQQDPSDLVQSIKNRRGGSLLNLDRMLLNSEPLAQGWNVYMGAIRNSLTVEPKLRELAICAVAVITRADYEYGQHAPEFLALGGRQEQLDAMRDMAKAIEDIRLFTSTERAVLMLAREMTNQVQVSEHCFANLQAALPDTQQQVELVAIISAYNMVSRFLEALQVPPEPDKKIPG
jgi:alkylhydroperoxidase family enzyme